MEYVNKLYSSCRLHQQPKSEFIIFDCTVLSFTIGIMAKIFVIIRKFIKSMKNFTLEKITVFVYI